MSTHIAIKQKHISNACNKFKTTNTQEIKKLLETQCIERMGVTKSEYSSWTRALEATPNHQLILIDRKQYREEQFVKSICKRLKIGIDTLHAKVKNYGYIQASTQELAKIRKFFGFTYNKHDNYIKNRPASIRKQEEKVIDMFSKGKKYREIAKATNKPMIDVITKINRLRARSTDPTFLPLRPPGNFSKQRGYTPENVGKLLREGKTVKELAVQFNKKLHTIQCMIVRWRDAYPHANIPRLAK